MCRVCLELAGKRNIMSMHWFEFVLQFMSLGLILQTSVL